MERVGGSRPLAGMPYDDRLAAAYDEGLSQQPRETFELWMDRFVHHAGERRPQTVLDLGSGTGMFTPALADAFGGTVFGVEPSDPMRAIAERVRPHPRVSPIPVEAPSSFPSATRPAIWSWSSWSCSTSPTGPRPPARSAGC
jgi:SAM-dependent methyltransferase